MEVSLLKIYLVVICYYLRVISCDYLVHGANTTIADLLEKKVTVLCVVLLPDGSSSKRQIAIENTWGKRCNKLTYRTAVSELGWKMALDQNHCLAIYQQYSTQFDWYLFINSEGYVIVENLRYMLAGYDPNDDVYFMSQSADMSSSLKFILSEKALATFSVADIERLCPIGTAAHSSKAKCFSAIGLKGLDSRDAWLRDRILPHNPYARLYARGHMKFWYCDRIAKLSRTGPSILLQDKHYDCFSELAVSFDYVSEHIIYVVDFLIYQLRPYGINYCVTLPNILIEDKQPKQIAKDIQDKNDDDLKDEGQELTIDI